MTETQSIQKDPAIQQEIDQITSSIVNAKREMGNAWLDMAINLHALKTKMDKIGDRTTNWRTYVNVESFKDYCERALNFSDKTCYQLIDSLQFIKDTRPQLIIDFETNNLAVEVPPYTKIVPIVGKTEKLKNLSTEKFNQVIESTYDNSVSRRDNDRMINAILSGQTIIEAEFVETQVDELKERINTYLDKSKDALIKYVKQDNHEQIGLWFHGLTGLSELKTSGRPEVLNFKRIIIHPSSQGKDYTKEIVDRVKNINPLVEIVYLGSKNGKAPNSFPSQLSLHGKYWYMKESLLLREFKSPFIESFPSPGDIVEELCTMLKLGFHCRSICQYCYLQGSNQYWQVLYTNIDKVKEELLFEPFVHRSVQTIWSAYTFYNEQSTYKIPDGLEDVGNDIRAYYKKTGVNSDSKAIQYLQDNIHSLLDPLIGELEDSKIKKIKQGIPHYYERNRQYHLVLNSGEYTDLIAGDPIAHHMKFIIKEIVEQHDDIRISIWTKSANFDEAIKHQVEKRVQFTIGINTEHVIQTYERGTATLEERIKGIKELQSNGSYRIVLCLEPIIQYPDCEEEYVDLIHMLMKEFATVKIVGLKMSCLRIRPSTAGIAQRNHPYSDLFSNMEMLPELTKEDKRKRYDEAFRIKIYKKVIETFRQHSKSPITLGAEIPEMWDWVGLDNKSYMKKQVYQYYILADDGTHEVTAPFNITNEVYSFYVTLFSDFANLGGVSDTYGNIELAWSTPIPMTGTLEGLKLYRSTSPNLVLTGANLYQSFASSVTSYTDSNVEEGDTYYYRLTGFVAIGGDTTESVVSSEIGIMSDDATVVRVRGVAYLQNQSDHTGTKVYFEKTSPSAVTDSVYTNADGYYDIVVVTGIYNAHFTHDAYQPRLLGHQFFSDNAYLDTLTLVPGGVVELTGNVDGVLTSNNLYFVDGNITIPTGDTLTIQAGTQVLFRGNYTLTANGKLFINGTAGNKVIFSSRTPVPAVGDWGTITLNSGATGSVIKYAIYKYATDGFICNNMNQLTIWGCEVNTLALNARAITLNNCENVDIRYNTLYAPGDWAISKSGSDWDNSGIFISNNIQAANSGMYIRNYYNLTVDSNMVQTTNIGIRPDYSRNMLMRYNSINGQNHSYGIHAYDCDGAQIIGNYVNGSSNWSYFLSGSQNLNFYDNEYYYSGTYGSEKGVYSGNCAGSQFIANRITYSDSLGNAHHCYGFSGGTNSIYLNNRLLIWKSGNSNNCGFRDINNSFFEGNYVLLQAHGGGTDRETAFHGSGNTSINDTLIIGLATRGYYGSNWTIRGAIIEVPNSNNSAPAIECRGGVLNINDVSIRKSYSGIYGSGIGGHIRNTLIDVYGSQYGLKFENNSTMDLYKNTIVGNNAGTGIWTTSNATVTTNSNIIDGFTTGLNAESPNTIQTSLFYDNTTNFSGSELPPQVGDVVTVNSNADPSDIYGNIFLNPQFVHPDTGNYHLLAASPAINAGDIDSLDLDGSVADIGVYFYNFGYVPKDLVADSTGSGFVAISWDILSSDSIQHFIPYYKLTSISTWTQTGTTTDSSYIYTGLNNNTSYHFAVAVQYPNHESDRSATLTAKPGLAQIALSKDYIVSELEVNVSGVETFQISNIGNKDLIWSIDFLGGSETFNPPSGTLAPGLSETVSDSIYPGPSQVYASYIVIHSNDPDTPIDTIDVLKVVGNHAAIPPDHFTPIGGGSDTFIVVISSAILDGSLLQSGDEVGIFDPGNGDACVGAGLMTGQFPYVIRCNNYTPDADFTVKIYDYSQARETEAQYSLAAGSSSFINDAFAYGGISGSIYQSQTVVLNTNSFNLISMYLYPRYPNMSNVFSGLDSLEIVYNDQGQAYIPRYGINSIGNYAMVDGYHIFTRDQNASVSISGLPINSADYPITIEAQRFNSIAYLHDAAQPVVNAMPSLTGLIEIIQDDAGGVYIPDLSVNTLGNLQPGKGYQIFIKGTTDQTITYSSPPPPDNDWQLAKAVDVEPEQSLAVEYFTAVQPTGLAYTIVIAGLLIDGHELPFSGEIAVFDGDVCVGASRFDDFPVVITAWGGSKDYDLPGFAAGEQICYRAYIEEYGREIELIGESGASFGVAPYTLERIGGTPGIIPQEFYLAQNYPNPFNPSTNIAYGLAKESSVSLIIYDLLGRTVWSLDAGSQIPGHYEIEWHGRNTNNEAVASGMYFYRIIAGDNSIVKKMILIR